MKRGGHRNITRVILLLALGAIVNVAVAWGLALTVDPQLAERVERGVDVSDASQWEVFRSRRLGTDEVRSLLFHREIGSGIRAVCEVTPEWCWLESPDQMLPFPPYMVVYQARGWPCVALAHQFVVDSAGRSGTHSISLGLPDFDGKRQSPRLLPCRPIWSGFAINTVFYAVILWVLFAAPFAMRRRLRIKRGLCPDCAYDLRESRHAFACPECGAAK